MSIPPQWFQRNGGSELNSGGSDADIAVFSSALGVVVGTNLNVVAGGFNAIGSNALGVNLQVGGLSEIRGYTVVDDANITLSAAPSAGNGTYAIKIGGGRVLAKNLVNSGANLNAVLATGHVVNLQSGTTVTEVAIAINVAGVVLKLNGATIDGTGGGAGSDVVTTSSNTHQIDGGGGSIVNAVDRGIDFTGGSPTSIVNLIVSACGGIGLSDACLTTTTLSFCSFRTCSVGLSCSSGSGVSASFCDFVDCTSNGATARIASLCSVICARNGGDGWNCNNGILQVQSSTFEGNTGDGMEYITVLISAANSTFVNNIVSNNAGTGMNISVGAITAVSYWIDYNDFYGNGTARANFPTGTHDLTGDPGFTNRAGGDLSILSTGTAYKAGKTNFKNPTLNKLNIGAVPGIGSAQAVGGGGGGMMVFRRFCSHGR